MASTIPLTDYMFSKSGALGIPLNGTFELSPLCNFACKMCYVRKTREEVAAAPRKGLELGQWLDVAREARAQGMLYILLTGGEPMLFPDFWPLYESLVRMGFLVSVNTNGSLMDAEAIRRFRKLPPRRINLTMYGASDETYERLCGVKGVFHRIQEAVRGLHGAEIQVKLNCSLTPDNAGDLEALIAFSQEEKLVLQVADYMFPPIRRDETMTGRNERFSPKETAHYRLKTYELQRDPEAAEKFRKSILGGSILPPGLDEGCIDPVDGKVRCRAGTASFWVTWDGQMTPCGMMTNPAVDLCTDSFSEAWKKLTALCREMRLSGICAKCPDFELCHACAAMALAETGDVRGVPTYLCEVVREMKMIAMQSVGES